MTLLRPFREASNIVGITCVKDSAGFYIMEAISCSKFNVILAHILACIFSLIRAILAFSSTGSEPGKRALATSRSQIIEISL